MSQVDTAACRSAYGCLASGEAASSALSGHQLPSGSALMARYGVARQTGQNAVDLLRGEGLVIGRQGAGWFVREKPAVLRLASAAEPLQPRPHFDAVRTLRNLGA